MGVNHPPEQMRTDHDHVRVLFVCLGNICRSPLADGLMRRHASARGLERAVLVDSAGTGPWHVGEHPDRRMRTTARAHGLSIDELVARQFKAADFETFDHIIVMDRRNETDVLALDPAGRHRDRVRRLREFDPDPGDGDVPDPYYGGDGGFDRVYAIVERSTRTLLDHVVQTHGLA